jgi:[glutamine synthetase] adenylyltransferase / [glutamine synthetase]-adenylyl-L-tyrosine phosphorylase
MPQPDIKDDNHRKDAEDGRTARLSALCHDAGPELMTEHLARMDRLYLRRYSDEQIARHLDALAGLGASRRCFLLERELGNLQWEITVAAFDYHGLFSLIAGSLASMGISIEQGAVWTYSEAEQTDTPEKDSRRKVDFHSRRYLRRRGAAAGSDQTAEVMRRKKIIDIFTVRATDAMSPDWRQLEKRLNGLIGKLAEGKALEAREEVNRCVVGYLSERQRQLEETLLPVEVDIDNKLSDRYTVMDIKAQDTDAFLFLFTNALAMRRVDIHTLSINTTSGRIKDRLYITDRKGAKISGRQRIDELKFIVVLVKQFSHLLVRSPDPIMALSNFERLVERFYEDSRVPGKKTWQLLNLQEKSVMEALARLFGTSNFLWEDFLRLQYENLLPVFADLGSLDHYKDRATMWAECELALLQKRSFEAAAEELNRFKDREMFRIDMRHILDKIKSFSEFSHELTDLADVVIEAAYRISDSDLRQRYGKAVLEDDSPCMFAIFALGKAGGRELGYASDIELLFIYSGAGFSDGREPISNHEYHVKLVQKIIKSVISQRQGIFELDLRFRPHGNQGPLSNSLAQIEEYYSKPGQAWDFERQCLVRLRFIAGDDDLGRRVSELLEHFVYRPEPLNMKELSRLRHRQLEEFVKPETWNAKFSRGGLVDLEYHVQHLQIEYGDLDRSLRRASTSEAIQALRSGDYLSEEESGILIEAHEFLRRLINALRILRGNARDLLLPDQQSREFLFLARRMGYPQGGENGLSRDLEHHRSQICRLVDWDEKVERYNQRIDKTGKGEEKSL